MMNGMFIWDAIMSLAMQCNLRNLHKLVLQGRLRRGTKEGGQAVRPPRVQARVPRILIVKGLSFFKKYIFLYKKIINIINKIEKDPKIFDMHIFLFSSQNIQNITDSILTIF